MDFFALLDPPEADQFEKLMKLHSSPSYSTLFKIES